MEFEKLSMYYVLLQCAPNPGENRNPNKTPRSRYIATERPNPLMDKECMTPKVNLLMYNLKRCKYGLL